MQTEIRLWTVVIWSVVGIVWLIAAVFAKPTKHIQSPFSRLFHIAVAGAAFALVFDPDTAIGPLAMRFVPDTLDVAWTGFMITVFAALFTIWARLYLGGNWSAVVTIKDNHELVRRGPYRLVRHPIYAGMLLGLAGTALVFGEYRCLAGLLVAFLSFLLKYKLEERYLVEEFGDAYRGYRKRVKALIPFVL